MIEYNWFISALDCHTILNDKSNVVYTIHWRLSGIDGEYSVETYGTVGVEVPAGSVFVEYEDLTKETVIEWLENSLGEELISSYKDSIANQIEEKKAPKTVTMTPTWG